MKSLFVKSDAHPLLAEQLTAYTNLEAAVIAAETAAPARLQAQSELFVPRDDDKKKRKGGKSAQELAEERKLAFVAACCREQAAFHPLADAMDAMYDLLAKYTSDFSAITMTLDEEDFFLWMRDAVYVNILECIKLYKRALEALSKINMRDYEWTLGVCAQQTAERELEWLKTIPKLPARENENPHWTHTAAHVMAHMLSAIEELRPGGGSTCIALDREEREDSASFTVAKALREKGWKTSTQDHPALCVQVPTES